jgi:lipopolysaccharide export system permease protein
MRIFTRYILFEVIRIFLLALASLTCLVVLGFGLKEGLRNGLPPGLMIQSIGYMLPESLGVTVPISMLLAVSFVYGRVAGGNELLALKAAGIHPWVIVSPVLVLATMLSLVTVIIYDVTAIWGRPHVRRLVVESVDEVAYSVLRNTRSFNSEQLSIVVKGVQGKRLIRPMITIKGRGDKPTMAFRAAEASLYTDHHKGVLVIQIYDGQAEIGDKAKFEFSNGMVYEIPLESNQRPLHRDWVSQAEIPEKVRLLQEEADHLRQGLRAAPLLSADEVAKKQNQLASTLWQLARMKTEPYRRWANGFTCLFFVMVGIPVAMLWRFDSFLSSFFACFLPILVVYYPLLMMQEQYTTSGKLHPCFFWSANFLIAIPGVLLFRRTVRY